MILHSIFNDALYVMCDDMLHARNPVTTKNLIFARIKLDNRNIDDPKIIP